MKNITIVYLNTDSQFKSEHIHNATTEKIQEFINLSTIHALEYIVEQHISLALNKFTIYAEQDELVQFIQSWNLDY